MVPFPGIPLSILNRREFLKRLGQGLALGSGVSCWSGCGEPSFEGALPFDGEVVGEDFRQCHALRGGPVSLQDTPSSPHRYDVIVVGAGISGLATAWKLVRSGVTNLLVLERMDRIGGTCIAEEGADIPFPWGAHYIESPQPGSKYLLEIGEDLGIIVDYIDEWPRVNPDYVVPEPEVSLLAGGRWRPAHFPIQVATSHEVMQFERFRQLLYRWAKWRDEEGRRAFGCPNQWTSPSEEVRRLDRITLREYLAAHDLVSKPLLWYVNNRMEDEYGCTVDNVSAWAGIHFWAQSNSSFMDLEPPGTPAPVLLSWPEGNAFLARGLAKGLTADQIRLNTFVTRIENVQEQVHVTCVGTEDQRVETLQARWVVFTGPKNLVYALIPGLKETGRTEFEACEYVPWVTAAVHLREHPHRAKHPPAWEVLAYDTWGLGYIDNLHMHHVPDRRGLPTVLTFYAALSSDVAAQRSTLLREGWDYWARKILDVLETMHPGIVRLITRLDVFKWGHPMVAMRPGFLWGDERRRMQVPFGRIHFGGVDVAGTPVFEQATYRGIEIAESILDALGVSYRSSL